MKRILFLLLMVMILSGCGTPVPQPVFATTTPAGVLIPFLTATATATPTPPNPATPTPLPSPTPTPITHTVKLGEDLFGIALRYRVPLDELKAANPTINPNAMKVGTVLVIPRSGIQPTANAAPSPTPVGVVLDRVNCLRNLEGGAWCFLLARNAQPGSIESVTARLRMVDGQGVQTRQQTASALLTLLPAGKSMPLAAYFAPPLPVQFTVGADLLTALPVDDGTRRYLPLKLENQRIEMIQGGLSAEVSGTLRLVDASQAAKLVWVGLVAYAADGQVVGMRRWESDRPLAAGGALDFTVRVYSSGAEINRVEVLTEARP